MSLFKISRGNSTNLDKVEKHDGYAWYTQDDAGFYIDAENSTTHVIERKRINDAEHTTLSSDLLPTKKNVKEAVEYIASSIYSAKYTANDETVTLGVPALNLEDGTETLSFYR